ncbi:response regulator [Spirosoma validum]|uniref:Inactive Receiver domain-containing protein n=1 Tax=Spirosoma validum TaxID=2771355 RepID=A0A927B8I6_9BACT|nr:hypothetical protein [Spirosoma validum]MBD2757107.1 hypothetical protein [Spirosoma validum]
MAKTLTLGKDESTFVAALGFKFIQLPRFLSDDDRHDFTLNTLKEVEFDKLVILIDSEDGYDGLKLGLHIRLTTQMHEKRLVPILFIASDTLKVILRQAGIWGRILTTKGCSLQQFDVTAIRNGLNFPPLRLEALDEFLRIIQLQPDETVGRHSLANQWGAYALNKAAGTNALSKNESLVKAQKQLYFKYIESINNTSKHVSVPANPAAKPVSSTPVQVNATGKKILLIDDEADKGWSDVLRVIFKVSDPQDFIVVNRRVSGWSDFKDEEKKLIIETGFDLFLVDMRLTGKEEEEAVEPNKFSGTDVVRYIKHDNNGNQVIVFTASNKVWNLKALLDNGADGYYIKESPEYNFSQSFSVENFMNFKAEAEYCLRRSFLKEMFKKTHTLKGSLLEKKKRRIINKELAVEISRYLNYSYDSITDYKTDNTSQIGLSMAYTLYFLILEALFKQLIDYDGEVSGNIYKFQFRKGGYLKKFNTDTGLSTGHDLEIQTNDHHFSPNIPYKQQLFNVIHFAGFSSDRTVDIVSKRNAFQHPDLTKNESFAEINLQDVIMIFEVVYKLVSEL